MSDEHRPRYTDERIHTEFTSIRKDLQDKHDENQRAIRELRTNHNVLLGKIDTGFAHSIENQRGFGGKQDKILLLLKQVCGDSGESGEGRLGIAEAAIENLKKFRWQAIAIVSAAGFVLEALKLAGVFGR